MTERGTENCVGYRGTGVYLALESMSERRVEATRPDFGERAAGTNAVGEGGLGCRQRGRAGDPVIVFCMHACSVGEMESAQDSNIVEPRVQSEARNSPSFLRTFT